MYLKYVYNLIFCVAGFLALETTAQRNQQDFNKGWKFTQKDDPSFSEVHVADESWRELSVPHDWAFENGVSINGAQRQGGGYHDGGVGWYRKTFNVGAVSLQNKHYIEFEGVYMNSEVWVNGTFLGKRPYGYISFRYDLSPYLRQGSNVIAVRVDNSLEPSARWYHPCGIYAPVNLIEVNPVHIKPNGIYITTPEISSATGQVSVDVDLVGVAASKTSITLRLQVRSPRGKVVQTKMVKKVKGTSPIRNTMQVVDPVLWSPETPNLYTLVTEVMSKDRVVDRVETRFGFRTIDWRTETGFWLNGQNVKIKGVCEHWEGGPVAGAWTKPMLRWKLQLIKEMGNNAIRPSHNPFPPMFYELCDEIGLLVMDELFDGWAQKAPYDYGAQAFDDWWQTDMTEWIKRDRNHPSIFIWSLGNETHRDDASELVQFGKALDTTRLFTSGASNPGSMEVIGINGGSENQSFIENAHFNKPFISTEAPHTWQTRGYYRTQTWWRDNELDGTYPLPDLTKEEIFFYEWTDPENWNNRKQSLNSSYDNATVRISARKNWELVRDTPWYSGNFRWTGFDYYGESGLPHGGWPFNLFMGGPIDVAGFKKDLYYFYQSQWTEAPMVHLLPHWTHPRMEKGTKIPVWAYSNADEVELFLNGRSLGKDRPGRKWDEMQCEWMVPYEEGTLEAIAYINGQEVARTTVHTAEHPSVLHSSVQELAAEDQFEASYIVTSEAQDSLGNLYPYAGNKVYYALQGDVLKLSLENGSPTDQTNRFTAPYRGLFMGKTRAFLQAKKDASQASVVIASILGDQSLYLSNQVTIQAGLVNILGQPSPSNIEIRYTTNGEDPLTTGVPYTNAFAVVDGTTVRAIVKQNDQVVIAMTEKFGTGEGLFWGDEHSEDVWIGRGLTVPAEEATLAGGAMVSREGRRFKGNGFVVFEDREGSITWYQENDGQPGEYNIRIRYTHNDQDSARPMVLTVNGEEIATFDFDTTGSWEEGWRFVHAKVRFQSGANNIELKTTGQSGPHIDELFVD